MTGRNQHRFLLPAGRRAQLALVAALVVVLGLGVATGMAFGSRRRVAQDANATGAPQGVGTASTLQLPPTTTNLPATDRTTSQQTASTTTGALSTSTSASGAGASILRRHDAPPGGVAAQVAFFAGGAGGPGCPYEGFLASDTDPAVAVPGSTAAHPETGRISVGVLEEFCFTGFEKGKPVTAQVTGPTGIVKTWSQCYACDSGLPKDYHPIELAKWSSMPGDPLGRYIITIEQAGRQVTGTVLLQEATQPLLQVVRASNNEPLRDAWDDEVPSPVPAGTTLVLGLAGYPHNSSVHVDVYVGTADIGRYATSFGVQTDGRGHAAYTLHTHRDDPKECYVLLTRPPRSDNHFPTENRVFRDFCLTY
jgi:hypothetical protein